MTKRLTVIHEGCNEEHYLNILLECLSMTEHIKVNYENFSGGSPKMAFEKYSFLVNDKERDITDNYLIIFDEDKSDAFKYKKEILNFSKKNTFIFTTNPCFEAFLIAHFEDNIDNIKEKCNKQNLVNSSMTNKVKISNLSKCLHCDTYLRHKQFIPGYSKDCSNHLKNHIQKDGIKRAKNQCENFNDLLSYIININSK
ncbi:MAG: hypothetical protein GQ570_06780 [Helicobacteraceae bacterium]|nr:hypothetical protein [Helicobacteraceae bacterium]